MGTIRIRLNPAAVERLVQSVKRIGDVADSIGRAAQSIADATASPKVRRARGSLRWMGAEAWASLLGRVFR